MCISKSSVRSDRLFNDEDEPQTELLQTETPPTVSHEPQIEDNIEQILPSPSIYQRKHRKTQKHRRAKKVIELPQTSVPLNLGADKAVHKEGTRSERVLKQPNEPPLLEGHTSKSEEGRMAHTFELMDIVPPTPYDSPILGGYTSGSDEGRLKLEELMAIKELKIRKKEEVKHLTPKKEDIQAVESFDDDLDEEEGGGGCNPIRGGTRRKIQRTRVSMWCGVFVLLASQWTRPTKPTVFDDEDVTMAMAQTLIKIG
ncbi:hypothetical protein Tco_0639448 [Tanacetum coccineum]